MIQELNKVASIDLIYEIFQGLLKNGYSFKKMTHILKLIIKYRKNDKSSKFIIDEISKELSFFS